MATINVHAAKTHFSSLLERVAAGEEIVIAKAGKPVARLTGLSSGNRAPRQLGSLAGRLTAHPDFDAPLPDDILDAFEGD